jgi:DNA-directed RNA polymerase specialized sigma24 family protein
VHARAGAPAARRTVVALGTLFQECGAEDRLILKMRFWDERKVPDIARTLNMDQKKIYKRLDKLFLTLRRGLEKAGVSKSDVADLLCEGDQEIRWRKRA